VPAAALLCWAVASAGEDGSRPGGAGFQRAEVPLPSWSARGSAPDAGAGGREVGSGVPPFVAVPGFKVHLFLDEELEPDAVRLLARPSCTAWVRTRTNMVRESVVERLARFGAAYVQLRAPFLEAHGAQLQRWPGLGAWLSPGDLRARGIRGLSGRPWAVSLFGELRAEDLEAVAAAKVAEVRWTPGPRDLTLEAWARFAQAPGHRVVAWPAGAPVACEAWARARAAAPPAIRVGGAMPVDALAGAVAACPLVTRVEVPPTVEDATLVRLFAASPRLELEVDVGASGAMARSAARLLDRLETFAPQH
jgi:hypothetical protein